MESDDAPVATDVHSADYELVCERVKRAQDRKAKSLSLTNYRALDRLPELDGLLTLNQFMVHGSSVKSLVPIAALRNLRRLFILEGRVIDLS